MKRVLALGLAALCGSLPHRAAATEGAAGHTLIGAGAVPGAGIVPPQPGVYWSNVNLYYGASASSALRLPVAGNVATGLRTDFSSFGVTGLCAPGVRVGPFSYAAAITVTGQYMDTRGSFGARTRSDTSGGFGDLILSPLVLGWNAGKNFAQMRLDVFAPTAGFNRGSLANIGMGYWTLTPTLAYTRLEPEVGLDVSASLGIDFNTRNDKTRYRSGALLHLDLAATKAVTADGRLWLGLLGSMLMQVEDDSGPLARVLDGFRGQSFAAGPLIRYGFRLGRMDVALPCAGRRSSRPATG